MAVLIVESNSSLGALWKRHLERQSVRVTLVRSQEAAVNALHLRNYSIIVLDLLLDEGSAIAISDFASYRRPDAKVIFVTNSTFFSDGSIFAHCSNACAYMQSESRPEDLAALVVHHAADR